MGKDKIEIQKQRKAIIDNYQRKIEELQNEKHQLQTEIEVMNKKLNDAMIEDFNFKGKYINIPDYGSMFVTSEWVDSEIQEFISCVVNQRFSTSRLRRRESIFMAEIMQAFVERKNLFEI